MRYSLGLDIGSESVGWAVVELDEENRPIRLVDMGVRCFDAVRKEQGNAETPAQERRIARSQRRRLRNKKKRRKKFVELSIEKGLVSDSITAKEYLVTRPGDLSPWQLRVQGLDMKLSARDWFRVLYHLINHRGYKSIKKGEVINDTADESKKMLTKAYEMQRFWREKNYRTVAEFLEKDEEWKRKHGDRRRNKEGSYDLTILRDDLIYEARLLFSQQRKLGNPFADEDFEQRFIDILDEPPNLQEGEKLIEKVGRCPFEINERRAPRATLTAQMFVAAQNLVNLKVIDERTGEVRSLTKDEIKKILDLAFQREKVTVNQALKALGNGLVFENKTEREELISLAQFHKVRKQLEKDHPATWQKLTENHDLFDEVASILTYYFLPESIERELKKIGIEEEAAKSLSQISFSGHLSLSLKAIKKILPYMLEGYKYHEACEKAGYNHTAPVNRVAINKIPPFESDEAEPAIKAEYQAISNPNVRRALNQARKVVNAIVREYGVPVRFGVEMAREMFLTRKRKAEISRRQNEHKKEREAAIAKIKEISPGVEINQKLIEKVLLYEHQAGKCAYSLREIDLKRLIEDPTYVEIDHIIPRSISFDNSMANKVLVFSEENRNKGDKLAAAHVKGRYGEEHFKKYTAFVEEMHRRIIRQAKHRAQEIARKSHYLLKEEITEEEKNEMRERYLKATQFASRFFLKVLRTYFDIPVSSFISLDGRITSELRYYTGFKFKKDRENDRHHAIDAVMCAICDHKMLAQLSMYFRARELGFKRDSNTRVDAYGNEYENSFEPWPNFRRQVMEAFEKIVVSRMPRRRASGRGHGDTIYSLKHVRVAGVDLPKRGRISLPLSKGVPRPTKRVRLDQLTLSQIEKILEEPSPILVDEKSNWRLYKLIRERLLATSDGNKNNWAERAFGPQAEPLRMPTKSGKPGPIVRKIKIFTDVLSGVAVRGGIAENDTIVRLDIYRKIDEKGKVKHYVVPVYAADIASGRTPKKAAVHGKPEAEWIEIDDSFEFLFYLFSGDVIRVWKNDKESQTIYMTSFDRSTVSISGNYLDRSNRDNNGSIKPIRLSITTSPKVEKLYVDILGRVSVVKREKQIYS